MDVALLSEGTIRIKGKSAAIVVNPTKSTNKTEADGIILLEKLADFSDQKIEGNRIIIHGPGDYEVGGLKVSAWRVESKIVAKIEVDGVSVLIGDGESMDKIHEKIEGGGVVVVNAENEFNYSNLSLLEPQVLLAYGNKKEEVKKSLGKTDAPTVSKFSTTADKLPEEMQMLLLG